jgi:transposase
VVQPSSVPVDRRVRRAKSDGIDAELLLRTLLAWLRGEPRVCSMVPIPTEADEDARRCVRERQDLLGERVAIANGIASILATLGARGYDPMRRDRRQRIPQCGPHALEPLPPQARARIGRMLDRLELVLTQIAALERQRDAVLDEAAPGEAERMIQRLVRLRGIGVQSATLLVREAFVRPFANGKALGAYAGLSPTPYSSGGTEREQGIGRAGNARLRTVLVELAWIWQPTLPAGQRGRRLVPRSPRRRRAAPAQGHGGGARAETPDDVLDNVGDFGVSPCRLAVRDRRGTPPARAGHRSRCAARGCGRCRASYPNPPRPAALGPGWRTSPACR